MDKIRWGILGTAKIGTNRVISAMQKGEYSKIIGIASRELGKAQLVAQQFALPKIYGSYDELLADPEIDVVYNPLPNHLHLEYAIKALEAGKHTLVEKPIAMNASEAQKLYDVAQNFPHLKIMEAFVYPFHPQWQTVFSLVQNGGIGDLRTIQSHFFYHLLDPDNYRQHPEMGGGGLLDIGCYCISSARLLFGQDPRRAMGWIEYDPYFKIDRLASAVLEFDNGIASFTVGTQTAYAQGMTIFGSHGCLRLETPFGVSNDQPARLWHTHDNRSDEIISAIADQYTIQGDEFSKAVLQDVPVPSPLSDSVANMKVIDAIFNSAAQNGWILI